MNEKDYLTLTEALTLLKVQASTLYSYVSRRQIRRIAQDGSRKSLYSKVDVDRLASRKRGRMGGVAAAASSMRWGEPVVLSSITFIDHDGPVYRNRAAIKIADSGATFESVAQHMYTGLWRDDRVIWPLIAVPEDLAPLLAAHRGPIRSDDIGNLLAMVTLALGMRGRGEAEMNEGNSVTAARLILLTLTGCLGLMLPSRKYIGRRPNESVAAYLLRAGGAKDTPEARRATNAAMTLLADHELAAATLTARVAASTNASLFNCVAAAISSHVGFTVGTATNAIENQLLNDIESKKGVNARALIRNYGDNRFGFNHPLYPGGDPRADRILGLAQKLLSPSDPLRNIFPFLDTVRASGSKPGVAFALAVLTKVLGLPAGSATAMWILARSTGWVAHVLEQRSQAFLMRPRARYNNL